jgi:hypothetical protein
VEDREVIPLPIGGMQHTDWLLVEVALSLIGLTKISLINPVSTTRL